MTLNPKTATAGGIAALATTGSSVGITHAATKETVWEKVKEVCLNGDLEDNQAWKIAQDKLKNSRESNLVDEFKNLKEELKKKDLDTEKEKNGEYLKTTCKYIYSIVRKSAIKGENDDENLIEQTKTYCSLTIKQKIIDKDLLPENQEEGWSKAQEKFKATKETDLSELFKTLKTDLSANPSSTNKSLKNTCKEIYLSKYQEDSEETKKLIKQTKDYCHITIGEMLISNQYFNKSSDTDATDKTKLQANLEKLKAHASNEEAVRGKISGTELFQIKFLGDTHQPNVQAAFKNWCLKGYETSFKGNSDNMWKLVNFYCKKQ